MEICIKTNAGLAHCTLCYFNNVHSQHWNWYLFCLFSLVLKKMLLVLSLVLILNQRFNELITGKYQAN